MFLSVYTPTYRRPLLLAQCQASVWGQSVPVEHVIVTDEVGIGIDGVYREMPLHAHKPTGDYVMVLSDDNVLADDSFADELEAEAEDNGYPDVVVFKGDLLGHIQPHSWGGEPRITCIDLSCFAVKRHIWQAHAADWGERYEGDFDFIHALYRAGYRFHWWDRLGFRALAISHGLPEAA